MNIFGSRPTIEVNKYAVKPFMGVNKNNKYKAKHRKIRRGGRLVLHKRKPLRDPMTAVRMAAIRARGADRIVYRAVLDEIQGLT